MSKQQNRMYFRLIRQDLARDLCPVLLRGLAFVVQEIYASPLFHLNRTTVCFSNQKEMHLEAKLLRLQSAHTHIIRNCLRRDSF